MSSIRCSILAIILFSGPFLLAQTEIIKGKIIADDDVDGIHVLNNTSKTFTISDSHGYFSIAAKLNDTLMFSGVSYQLKKVVISQQMLNSKSVTIHLTEKMNVLDEVIVGKMLTGNLSVDIANSDVKRDLNFYDLGIPGYTGKPKTQTERRLYEAGDFKPIHLLNLLGGSLPLNPILNAISGRTKELKERVRFENQDNCINSIKSKLQDMLFIDNALDEKHKAEFFYFCADDPQFDTTCALNDDIKMFEFLKEKLISFKLKLQTTTEE